MTPTRRSLCCLLALPLLLPACGYSSGSGLRARGVRTVHLRAVENDTYRQRLEVDLSAAVSREMSVSSDLLPGTLERADAILDLRITSEREDTLVVGNPKANEPLAQRPVLEGAQQVRVHVLLTDRRTGQKLVDRTVLDRAEFRTTLKAPGSATRSEENLSTARNELVADLARKIVLSLETPF